MKKSICMAVAAIVCTGLLTSFAEVGFASTEAALVVEAIVESDGPAGIGENADSSETGEADENMESAGQEAAAGAEAEAVGAQGEAYSVSAIFVPSTTGNYDIPAIVTLPEGDGPFPLVVMNHGFAGDKNEGNGFVYISRRLAESGIASVRMDFCGSGDSTEDFVEFSLTEAVNDSNDCLHYVVENFDIDEEQLGLFGYSNGGREALIITAEEDCPYKVRVLLAPGVEAVMEKMEAAIENCEKNGGYNEIEWFGRTLHVGQQYYQDCIDLTNDIEKYIQPGMPTLAITGTEDTMAPTVPQFAENAQADLVTIYGTTHSYGFYSDDAESYAIMDTVAGVTVSYFASHLTGNNAESMFAE